MPFQMPCKNCNKINEPYIEQKTDKVFCSLCDVEISNATHFAKIQMKALKQYKVKNKTSFSIKCNNCNKEARPLLTTNDDIICGACKSPLDQLTPIYKNMLKMQLKKVGQDL